MEGPAKGFLKGTEMIRLKNSAEQPISKLIVYRQVREGSNLSISAEGKDAIVLQEGVFSAADQNVGGVPESPPLFLDSWKVGVQGFPRSIL